MKDLKAAYPEGTILPCIVSRVEPFGAFVHLEDDPAVRGFIHRREWSWARREFDLRERVRPGEKVQASVVDHGPAELRLSRRRAVPDPYPEFRREHKVGDEVVGKVLFIAQKNAGVVLTLEGGIDAFVPRSELPEEAQARDGFGLLADDRVAARILRFDKDAVVVSVKEHLRVRDTGEGEPSALGYHPTLGLTLEDAYWDLRLRELEEPRIDPAVRRHIQRVLVVEDNGDVSASLRLLFEHYGFPCDSTASLAEARAWLAEHPYQLLILDIHLPQAQGAELVEVLPEGGTFVYVLTAARESQLAEFLAAVDGHRIRVFPKPTSIHRILADLAGQLADAELPAPAKKTGRTSAPAAPPPPPAAFQPLEAERRIKIEESLAHLQRETGAERACVLAYQPGPLFTLVAGHFPDLNREVQQNLEISPVGNLIRERTYLFVPDVSKKTEQFKHLLACLAVGSFAGLALEYRDQADYGLFLTAAEPDQLHGVSEQRLRMTALQIGAYLAEERFDQVITEKQSLLLAGFLADSLLHEIRNEVQALDDFAAIPLDLTQEHAQDLKAMRPEEVTRLKKAVVGIQDVSRHLKDLVLFFHHLSARPHEETVVLNQAVLRLVKTLQPFADDHDTTIESDLGRDIPDLRLNPKLLDQPLLNILINAVEQMALVGANRRRVRVATHYLPEEEYPVQITVADSGGGIHSVHREKIFELFFTTKEQGTGLGLYLSRYFLRRLEGRLRLVDSLKFSGSLFAIELPRAVLA